MEATATGTMIRFSRKLNYLPQTTGGDIRPVCPGPCPNCPPTGAFHMSPVLQLDTIPHINTLARHDDDRSPVRCSSPKPSERLLSPSDPPYVPPSDHGFNFTD